MSEFKSNTDDDAVAGPSLPNILEFIKGPNNKNLLVRGQYRHFLQYSLKKDGLQVWRCTSNRTCKAKVKVLGTKIIEEDRHTCPKSKMTSNVFEDFKKECMRLINGQHTPIPKVYRDVKKFFMDKGIHLVQDLPSYDFIRSTLYRYRNECLKVRKTTFLNTKDVEIPAGFEEFLLFDCKEEERIIIFATDQARRLLQEKEVFFMDGTFKSCAAPFYQLYTVHVDIGSNEDETNIRPVLFSLLPNKLQSTYELFFKSVKQCLPNWNPHKVFLDFEQGPINAIKICFPGVAVKGCLFHYKKALVKKSKELELSTKEEKDHVFRCAALARLPVTDVEDGWLTVMETSPPNEKITNFNNYFVDTWLNNPSLHFSIWNCEGERHCTTNLCEAWHKTLNGELKKKPRLLELLFKIREHADYFDKYHCLKRNRTKKSLNRDKKIKVIEKEYREKSITIAEALNQYKNL